MSPNPRKPLLVWLALALLAALPLWAASGENGAPESITMAGYRADSQTSVFRSQLSVVDASSIATLTSSSSGEFTTGGRPNLNVSARFTASGATVGVQVLRLFKSGTTIKVLGASPVVTLTAGSLRDMTTSYYIAPDFTFDTGGATHCRVIVTTAVSSGNVDLWLGSF